MIGEELAVDLTFRSQRANARFHVNTRDPIQIGTHADCHRREGVSVDIRNGRKPSSRHRIENVAESLDDLRRLGGEWPVNSQMSMDL